jgi:TolB-like protein/AraC-like DNA-binding protein
MSEHPAKDLVFISRLSGIILANLEDENFGVKELVKEAGTSYYSLKRRLKAITNHSLKHFIREVRLRRAMEILQHEEVNIAEVAYKVGFSSPAYFNTCFHELFGYPPGAVKKGDFVNSFKTNQPSSTYNHKKSVILTLLISSGILIIALLIYLAYIDLFKNSQYDALGLLNKPKKSIAVLPFKNLSDPLANQYFIDGLMEDIHSNLGKIHNLRVVSRTSTEQYRNNANKSIHEIARELGVDYIVEGSGQKYGTRFRLTVKLFKTASKETCLWVKSYEQEIQETDDLFKITSNIAQAIAKELEAIITPEEKQRIEKVPTTDLTALDFYQRGREEEGKFPYYDLTTSSTVIAGLTPSSSQSVERAEKMYRTALEYDSTYALAYTGLAGIYWRKNYHKEYFTETFLDSVLFLSEKALSFNDQLPDVYYIRGMYYAEKGDNQHALQDFDKALNLNSNYWLAYYGKGIYASDYITAIKCLLEAASLHPGSGLSDIFEKISFRLSETGFSELAKSYSIETIKLKSDSASYYFWLWMYEFDLNNCLSYYKKRYSEDPTDITAIEFLSEYCELTGQFKEDLKYKRQLLDRYKTEGRKSINNMHRVGYAYSKNELDNWAAFYFDKQIEYCHDAIRLGLPYGISLAYYDLAGVYAYKGNKTKAYENLEIFNQRSGRYFLWIVKYIKKDPLFNSIRNEPEFQNIVREMEAKYNAEHERVEKWLKEQGLL